MKIKFGLIIDSAEALKVYHDSTGKFPKRMDSGNTDVYFFNAPQDDGNHPAALIHQRGFDVMPGEKWDDVNGLSVIVSLDPDTDGSIGAALKEYVDAELKLGD